MERERCVSFWDPLHVAKAKKSWRKRRRRLAHGWSTPPRLDKGNESLDTTLFLGWNFEGHWMASYDFGRNS